jgi:hypothetical protein
MVATSDDVRALEPRWPLWVILAVSVAVHAWIVARTEVAARDSIGFIRYAVELERQPTLQLLRRAEQPPGYPATVLAASWPVRALRGDASPETLALAAQVASAVFGVLLVFPMVGLGTELFDRRLGYLAAALFQTLPAWLRYTSDGLSEAVFLFWLATALWLAARALGGRGRVSFAGCGLAAGAAFLTRPEGAEVVVAVTGVLAGLVVLGRALWHSAAKNAAALVLGFLLLFAPFVAITGRLTNKPTGRFLLGDPTAEKSYFGRTGSVGLLAVWWNEAEDAGRNRVLWAAEVLMRETASSARQVGFALAVVGLALWPRRVRNGPGGAVLMTVSALHAVLVVRMTSKIGYLSERHTAVIVLTGCYPAALALRELAGKAAAACRDRVSAGTLLVVAVAGTFAAAVPSIRRPLHGNRAGHKAAGHWLAAHAPESAGICDPFCWARYYAGRDFREVAPPDPPEQFVIVEGSDNQHSRLPLMPEAKAKAAAGRLMYHWPESVPADRAQVRVYRWLRPADDLTTPTANRSSLPTPGGG